MNTLTRHRQVDRHTQTDRQKQTARQAILDKQDEIADTETNANTSTLSKCTVTQTETQDPHKCSGQSYAPTYINTQTYIRIQIDAQPYTTTVYTHVHAPICSTNILADTGIMTNTSMSLGNPMFYLQNEKLYDHARENKKDGKYVQA